MVDTGSVPYGFKPEPDVTMTTYKRVDGEPIDEFGWVTELDPWFEDWDGEAVEVIKEVWVRTRSCTFMHPSCTECDAAATHWGMCEEHARLDDPESFEDQNAKGAP